MALWAPADGWAPVSRPAFVGWASAYALFLLYAWLNTSGFLFIDSANLMIHEMGHAVFGWGGYSVQILGGTLAQVLVPVACLAYFMRRGRTTAVAFSAFWGFENLLYVATYMADARRSALPLVGSDESDWTILFTHWGVLQHDVTIAAWIRGLGWIGMLLTVVWLGWKHLTVEAPAGQDWTEAG
jgi:hypothetical protein